MISVAELPQDPDGFEYSELWFVTMGRNAPVEMALEMVSVIQNTYSTDPLVTLNDGNVSVRKASILRSPYW